MTVPTIVINFGQSVLKSLEDYTEAASEIYRHYRQGTNIVAVTSAQNDAADVFMAEARRIGPEGLARNLPELIQLGERRSAALLALALERIGAPAFIRQARDLGLKASGPHTEAELVSLDVEQLKSDLQAHDVIVMPGFVGVGDNDRLSLLGEGGADMTALFVGHKLGAPILLLKDVPGVFETDPKLDPHALKYEAISWSDAQGKADVLIEPTALAYAKTHAIAFDVGCLGHPHYTRIGAKTGDKITHKPRALLRLAMMGCGVVGGGIFRRVEALGEAFEIVSILVRDPEKYIDQGYPAELLTTDFDALKATNPDVFIDVSGPVDPALDYTQQMLALGVHVVSANKQAIAEGGKSLLNFAHEKCAVLAFSSAAGGGMPVLEMCQREAGKIVRVEALLNGTTNYMLDEIMAGKSYEDALKDAQDKGFAEADPTADVDGWDAAAKIRLVALLAFDEEIGFDDIPRDSIAGFTPNNPPEGAIKRVSICWRHREGFNAALELKDLSLNNFIAQANGEEAHAIFYLSNGDSLKIRGKGAGRWPTTEAVIADLYDIYYKD